MKFRLILSVLFLAHYAAGDGRVKRVVGGQPMPIAGPGEPCSAPYAVIIRRFCNGRNTPEAGRCAGTIINNDLILTSSECVRQTAPCTTINRVELIAGAHYYNVNDNQQGRVQIRNAQPGNIYRHLTQAMALIYLGDSTFDFNTYVGEADVPDSPAIVGQEYRAMGWGAYTHGNQNQFSEYLRYIDDLSVRAIYDNNMLLVMSRSSGSQGAGVYVGDAGGPIIRYGNRENCEDPEVMGITGCPNAASCPNNGPAYHINVYNYRQWIREIEEGHSNGATGVHGIGTAAIVFSLCTMLIVKLF